MKQETPEALEPIDLVFTWVDGDDPAWKATRRRYYYFQNPRHRWSDSGELALSLETFRRFAPWIATVYIVHADSQRPRIPFTNVRMIPHSEIMPASHLPTFNSNSIEAYLHRIPGLAEHFIYANDDTFLTARCTPEDFFAAGKNRVFISSVRSRAVEPSDGKFTYSLWTALKLSRAIARHHRNPYAFLRQLQRTLDFRLWRRFLFNANQLLDMHQTRTRFPPLHLLRPLRRSVCELAWQRYAETLDRTTRARFRRSECIAFLNFLVPYFGVELGKSVLVDLPTQQVPFMACVNRGGGAGVLEKLMEDSAE